MLSTRELKILILLVIGPPLDFSWLHLDTLSHLPKSKSLNTRQISRPIPAKKVYPYMDRVCGPLSTKNSIHQQE